MHATNGDRYLAKRVQPEKSHSLSDGQTFIVCKSLFKKHNCFLPSNITVVCKMVLGVYIRKTDLIRMAFVQWVENIKLKPSD